MQDSSLSHLIELLKKIPSVGEKTAKRLAFHLVSMDEAYLLKLSEAILSLKEKIKLCSLCFNLSEEDPCSICKDERREKVICVVESPSHLLSIEKAGFRGLYHVLHGLLAPEEGITPKNLNIDKLIERVKSKNIKEVIIATNPSFRGEATAHLIKEALSPLSIKVTRIAIGVPFGGDIEYLDKRTLSISIKERKEVGDV